MGSIDITSRFLEALEYVMQSEGLTKADIARSIGLTPQKLSNISTKTTKDDGTKSSTNCVRAEALGAFCEVYENINPDYILTGRGSMFVQEEDDEISEALENALDKLELLQNEVKRLEEENQLLRTAFSKLHVG